MRLLSQQGMLDTAVNIADVAPQLGDWLDFRQAISLHGVLNPQTPAESADHTQGTAVWSADACTQLGMLGTFWGMVVTLNGAVFVLEGSNNLAGIRAAFSEPI